MKSAVEARIKNAVGNVLSRLGSFVPRDIEARMSRAEEDLFERFQTPADIVPIVFILASPRTGSTLLHQLMAKHLRMHYFSNYVARSFPEYPLIGTVIESVITEDLADVVSLRSRYGVTEGLHEPSEATQILRNWFPHEHPTETMSARVRGGKRAHLTKTMAGIAALTGKPIVIKNAWNCFRVRELASLFPASRFIWLRRDIAASSYSTLQARRTKGDPATVWNSGSPANFREIRRLPYIEQVVEQQYWTNAAVEKSLRRYVPKENQSEVWYEDILVDPVTALTTIAGLISHPRLQQWPPNLTTGDFDLRLSNRKIESEEFDQILRYAEAKYSESVRQ